MGSVNYKQLLEESGGGIELLPDGEYDAVIDTCKVKAASTGKTMFIAKFKVLTGPHANKPLWNNFVISPDNPNALGFFFQHMQALGLDRAFFAVNPEDEQVAAALVGRQARLTIGHDTMRGTNEVRNQVTSVKPLAGAMAPPMVAQPGLPGASVAPPVMPGQPPIPMAPQPAMPMPAPPMPMAPQPMAPPMPVPAAPPMPGYEQPVAQPVYEQPVQPGMPVAPPIPMAPPMPVPMAPAPPMMPQAPIAPTAPPPPPVPMPPQPMVAPTPSAPMAPAAPPVDAGAPAPPVVPI